MFWRNIYTPSRIDTLLDNESITLQELMEEDDIVQECKSSNKKLIDFLARPEIVDSLLKMVLEEPDDECSEKLHFKYSNIACELIASDINQITDILAMADTSISSLLSFLERPEPLNPLQASFFSKIMGLLISRKSDIMLESVKSRYGFIGHLLRHLGTSAVMDLLLRLMTCVDEVECRVKYITWLNDEKLVQHLVDLINSSETSEKNTNAAQTLCDIIRLGRDSSSSLPDEPSLDVLLKELEKSELLSGLLDRMFNGDNCESVIVNGLCVLQALLEPKRTNEMMPEEKSEMPDNEPVDVNENDVYKTLSQYLKHFHNLLVNPPKQHYTPMPLSVGTLSQPLGITRLQVASVIALLVTANNTAIDNELASLRTLDCLLNLFFQFPWNNFLHTQVELCVSAIVGQKSMENPLLPQVVKDFDLLRKIVEAFDESPDQQEQQGKRPRLGFLGHLTRIANLISSKVTMDAESHLLAKLFKELPEDGQQQWNTFVGGTLSTTNHTNALELGGSSSGRGRIASSSEDDDDICHLNFQLDDNLQKAFADYQTQQMTSNFVEQFGFAEEEIFEQEESISSQFLSKISSIDLELDMVEDSPTAAAMFEQACNDQIRQFDANDSDGDSDMKEMFGFSGMSNFQSCANRDGDHGQSFNNDEDEDAFGAEETEDNNGSTDSNEDLSPRLMQKANEAVDRDVKVPSELINNNVPHPTAAAAAADDDDDDTLLPTVNGEATISNSDDGALLSNAVESSCCDTNNASEVANGVSLDAIDIHISNDLSNCSVEGLTDHRQLVAGDADIGSNST